MIFFLNVKKKNFGDIQLEVNNWSAFDRKLGRYVVKDVDFNIRKGEIVGVAGLMGAGRTEFAHSIFGNSRDYQISGELKINNKKNSNKKSKTSYKKRISLCIRR